MGEVKIDLEAANPMYTTKEPEEVREVNVVFVPWHDTELRINQTVKQLRAGIGVKVTRDECRILLDANRGYVRT